MHEILAHKARQEAEAVLAQTGQTEEGHGAFHPKEIIKQLTGAQLAPEKKYVRKSSGAARAVIVLLSTVGLVGLMNTGGEFLIYVKCSTAGRGSGEDEQTAHLNYPFNLARYRMRTVMCADGDGGGRRVRMGDDFTSTFHLQAMILVLNVAVGLCSLLAFAAFNPTWEESVTCRQVDFSTALAAGILSILADGYFVLRLLRLESQITPEAVIQYHDVAPCWEHKTACSTSKPWLIGAWAAAVVMIIIPVLWFYVVHTSLYKRVEWFGNEPAQDSDDEIDCGKLCKKKEIYEKF